MEAVRVKLGLRSYYIYIGAGVLGNLGRRMKELACGKKVMLVSNPAVLNVYGDRVKKSLAGCGFEVVNAEIGAGEGNKTLATAGKLYDAAFSFEMDRKSPVVALGGGVVGDVAGFVAATYMRGVPFIQVPTTLLAQVDSSVGGKVAVNHPGGKNIIGAFYQPRLVLIDINTLKTLPPREVRSGVAEVIKYGVIENAKLFAWLEEHIELLLCGERKALTHVVRESCRIKARVTEKDETEQGLRAILNYGHTVGHAVEALAGYGQYTHGEAVSIGMAVAARLAAALGLLPGPDRARIEKLLQRAGLPLELPEEIPAEAVLDKLYHDKKTTGGRLNLVLPELIGKVSVKRDIPAELLTKIIRAG
jgi:3-dehydroquinate synthase